MRNKIKTPDYIRLGIAPKAKKSLSQSSAAKKKPISCSCCGEHCSGNLNIEARKGKLYPFCTDCNNSMLNKDSRQIRKKIRENKLGVIC